MSCLRRIRLPRDAHRPALLLAACAAALGLAGCESLKTQESLWGLVTPYRMEIVQGNVVTKEQVAIIKPGVTRAQVRDLLGSPMLADVFHADRWDYVFTIRRQGTAPQRISVVARFEGDRLTALEAPDNLPTEKEFVASITRTHAVKPVVLELTDEQRQALPKPAAVAANQAKPTDLPLGPARTYPPLEQP
jgi:outer membrane protein assembly factor BamE